jgi:hypothetical protein
LGFVDGNSSAGMDRKILNFFGVESKEKTMQQTPVFQGEKEKRLLTEISETARER